MVKYGKVVSVMVIYVVFVVQFSMVVLFIPVATYCMYLTLMPSISNEIKNNSHQLQMKNKTKGHINCNEKQLGHSKCNQKSN